MTYRYTAALHQRVVSVKLVHLHTHHIVADALAKSPPAPGLQRHRSVGHTPVNSFLYAGLSRHIWPGGLIRLVGCSTVTLFFRDYFAWGWAIIHKIIGIIESTLTVDTFSKAFVLVKFSFIFPKGCWGTFSMYNPDLIHILSGDKESPHIRKQEVRFCSCGSNEFVSS